MDLNQQPQQKIITDFIIHHPRCNVFASPGVGKTSSTLVALQALSFAVDVWPVLIVAPQRVANTVWDAECEKWARFNSISVSVITGSAAARREALRRRAQIYTINYENLDWLVAVLGDSWPFKTVVADESTRLKNHRCSYRRHPKTGRVYFQAAGKSKNAAALASRALRTRRWINLTGTPSPKGLEDLWGQCWYIDFGRSLGASYSAYMSRFFRRRPGASNEFAPMEPLDGALETITKLIAPFTVTIDAYEWVDVTRPVTIDVPVVLPPKLMDQYRELHNRSVLEIEGLDKITAANAVSKIMKCRQFAAGRILQRDDAGAELGWVKVHDQCLTTLKNLVEEIDEPVVIATWFRWQPAALKELFPDCVELPKERVRQKAVEAAWNAGKIRVLQLHPQSAGHGLSLQYGGRSIIIMTPDWNAEYYQQVIERLGPVRQAAAGFKRLVNVYRLVVKGTWDPTILRVVEGKITIEQAVKDATGRRPELA